MVKWPQLLSNLNVTQHNSRENHDPIAKVTRMLEQSKKPFHTKDYIEMLSGDIAAGQADQRTYPELRKSRDSY